MPMGHGFDPVSGQPYSDKSKVAAGLLQLLPGFFLALGGIGRLYAGHITLGVVQLVVSVVVWVMLACLFWLIFPFLFIAGTWLWAVIDGIILLAGRSTDGQGRLLHP
jgi:TM2 domain-containing membrane protein YozV